MVTLILKPQSDFVKGTSNAEMQIFYPPLFNDKCCSIIWSLVNELYYLL